MGKERSNINLQYDRQKENQKEQNEWQSSENAVDRAFQEDLWLSQFEAERQQQERMFDKESERWQQQFDVQNAYNQPKAQVARLLAAGINPAAMAGNLAGLSSGSSGAAISGSSGASSPSPSGVGSHGVTPLGLQNPYGVSSDAAMFTSVAQLADSVAKLGESGIQSYGTMARLQPTIDNLVADTQARQEQAALTAVERSIRDAYGNDAAAAEILQKVASSYSLYARGDLDGAQKLYTSALTDLTNQEKFQKSESFSAVLTNLKKYGSYLDSQVRANNASAVASYASANASNASARLSDSLAKTNDALRDGQVKALDLSNQLADISRQLQSRENVRDAATHYDKISAIISQCEREGFITRQAADNARKAATDADWAEVEHVVGCASEAIGAFSQMGHVYNGYVSNLNQQQRNQIQQHFVDAYSKSNADRNAVYGRWVDSQGKVNTQKVEESQSRVRRSGVGDIMEHVVDTSDKPNIDYDKYYQRTMSREQYERWKRENGR